MPRRLCAQWRWPNPATPHCRACPYRERRYRNQQHQPPHGRIMCKHEGRDGGNRRVHDRESHLAMWGSIAATAIAHSACKTALHPLRPPSPTGLQQLLVLYTWAPPTKAARERGGERGRKRRCGWQALACASAGVGCARRPWRNRSSSSEPVAASWNDGVVMRVWSPMIV